MGPTSLRWRRSTNFHGVTLYMILSNSTDKMRPALIEIGTSCNIWPPRRQRRKHKNASRISNGTVAMQLYHFLDYSPMVILTHQSFQLWKFLWIKTLSYALFKALGPNARQPSKQAAHDHLRHWLTPGYVWKGIEPLKLDSVISRLPDHSGKHHACIPCYEL